MQKHHQYLDQEKEKCVYAMTARRRAIERIGLPQVREYRLVQLAQEEKTWNEQIQQMAEVVPELVPLLLIRVES
ncbi:hypothetical protein F7734_02780 [Scytonema sp. UIC 10036]|uniref:hypothetical protein n=1 Tax=Scytonema sp. UIC 10036 TaxID=2304196 RepID=UPI0012DA82C2|nr:hypothetical protein [Scytonema sp. UIC 10036]MUG91468.1 hypothetical protein [Scytonema sp. UIC 10036]